MMVKTHKVLDFLQEFEEIGSLISVASPVEIKTAFPFNPLDIMNRALLMGLSGVMAGDMAPGPDGSLARAKLRGLAVIRPGDFKFEIDDDRETKQESKLMNGYIVTNGSGYTRVTVSPAQVKVEYVRMYLSAAEPNGQYSGMIGHSYVIDSPQVNGITLTNGQAQLLLNGTLFQNHSLEASTNLATWSTVLNTNLSVTPFLWSDPDSPQFSRRFYRFWYGP